MTLTFKLLLPATTPPDTHPSQNVPSPGVEHQAAGIVLHPEWQINRKPVSLFFQWNISQGIRAPDGVKKRVYLVNNEFPGPTIEARSGDEIVVEVQNNLGGGEGVAIHWHGLKLFGGNAFDGAVGITQCAIPPGKTFTYHVKIGGDEHGTFWWHAHSQVQRGDGIFGGLVVHRVQETLAASGEKRVESDMARYGYDREMLLMIGDWFHSSAQDNLKWFTGYEHFGNEPVPDSLLINGKGRYDCSLAVPARPVDCTAVPDLILDTADPEKAERTRWRIINTGSIAGFNLSSVGVTIAPIQVDGGIEVTRGPATQGVGVLHPGERLDVISSPATGPQRLVVSLDPENFKYTNPALNPSQSFAISPSVSGLEELLPPAVKAPLDLATLTPKDDQITPLLPVADQTILLYVKTQILAKFSNQPKAFINHTSWEPQSPPLISLPREKWDKNQLVPSIATTTSQENKKPVWVDIVINNLDDGSHPFHLHGHQFWVLSSYRSPGREAWGSCNPFDGSRLSESSRLNLVSPLKKDTVSVPRRGYVVIRVRADNPGIWMLHCHMLVHLGSGMAMALHVPGVPGDEGNVHSIVHDATQLCTRETGWARWKKKT
ncbi:multicopper oxidase-domain-containing protein [Diplogelasinospora grovesii]|uniref:Multicopper oxidase-domain-containing protein n=1 Tax=Diplogelasinospora grovesii TaxID=303347 RepID=A0AAN6N7E8_9PEZI|nr:multicopper oxidase-domain-containing protein [Diplogelasinospora grovesii]